MLETRGHGNSIARRRECLGCRARLTTIEVEESRQVAPVSQPKPKPAKRRTKKQSGHAGEGARNNAVGLKVRAQARRRLEDMRDAVQIDHDDHTLSDDDLMRELGL